MHQYPSNMALSDHASTCITHVEDDLVLCIDLCNCVHWSPYMPRMEVCHFEKKNES